MDYQQKCDINAAKPPPRDKPLPEYGELKEKRETKKSNNVKSGVGTYEAIQQEKRQECHLHPMKKKCIPEDIMLPSKKVPSLAGRFLETDAPNYKKAGASWMNPLRVNKGKVTFPGWLVELNNQQLQSVVDAKDLLATGKPMCELLDPFYQAVMGLDSGITREEVEEILKRTPLTANGYSFSHFMFIAGNPHYAKKKGILQDPFMTDFPECAENDEEEDEANGSKSQGTMSQSKSQRSMNQSQSQSNMQSKSQKSQSQRTMDQSQSRGNKSQGQGKSNMTQNQGKSNMTQNQSKSNMSQGQGRRNKDRSQSPGNKNENQGKGGQQGQKGARSQVKFANQSQQDEGRSTRSQTNMSSRGGSRGREQSQGSQEQGRSTRSQTTVASRSGSRGRDEGKGKSKGKKQDVVSRLYQLPRTEEDPWPPKESKPKKKQGESGEGSEFTPREKLFYSGLLYCEMYDTMQEINTMYTAADHIEEPREKVLEREQMTGFGIGDIGTRKLHFAEWDRPLPPLPKVSPYITDFPIVGFRKKVIRPSGPTLMYRRSVTQMRPIFLMAKAPDPKKKNDTLKVLPNAARVVAVLDLLASQGNCLALLPEVATIFHLSDTLLQKMDHEKKQKGSEPRKLEKGTERDLIVKLAKKLFKPHGLPREIVKIPSFVSYSDGLKLREICLQIREQHWKYICIKKEQFRNDIWPLMHVDRIPCGNLRESFVYAFETYMPIDSHFPIIRDVAEPW